MTRARHLWPAVILLLALWGTRIAALEALPLHNDEGLHLARAIAVWDGHPFWDISDGKIVNHWLIALFYPQQTPVFAARIATVLVALPGLAAACALARQLVGEGGALLAGVFWLLTPYLFFYERLAQSDVQAGALALVALWGAYRLSMTGRPREAIVAGLALAAAGLFKISAAPFALSVLIVVLLGGHLTPRQRLRNLLIIGAIGAVCLSIPLLYLILRRGGDFSVALGWVNGSGPLLSSLSANLTQLGTLITGETAVIAGPIIAIGLGLLAVSAAQRRRAGLLLVAGLLPLATILLLARTVEPRHFGAAIPAAVALAGAGWGALLARLPGRAAAARYIAGLALTGLLAAGFVPFAALAYREPERLSLPPAMACQYLTDHSAGFGLREAVRDFPQTIGTPGVPIIAAMFGDSCRRANFYAAPGYAMQCPDYPGLEAVRVALSAGGPVYVLEDTRLPGFNPLELGGGLAVVARYPRPGEPADGGSVVLWRLDSRVIPSPICLPCEMPR